MRTYDVGVASLAIGAPLKWTDNLLSHHEVPGVLGNARGVARKIPYSSLLLLAVVRELHEEAGLGVREALALARRLVEAPAEGVPASEHLRVSLDRAALERGLALRLRDALESAPAPRRGRPPLRRTGAGVGDAKRGGTVG